MCRACPVGGARSRSPAGARSRSRAAASGASREGSGAADREPCLGLHDPPLLLFGTPPARGARAGNNLVDGKQHQHAGYPARDRRGGLVLQLVKQACLRPLRGRPISGGLALALLLPLASSSPRPRERRRAEPPWASEEPAQRTSPSRSPTAVHGRRRTRSRRRARPLRPTVSLLSTGALDTKSTDYSVTRRSAVEDSLVRVRTNAGADEAARAYSRSSSSPSASLMTSRTLSLSRLI